MTRQGAALWQLPGLLILCGVVGLGFATVRRAPIVAFGVTWLVITLLPSSNFILPSGSTDYVIDFNAVSTPLNLVSINLRFNVVPGTNVDGATSFTFDRGNNAALFDRLSAFFRQNLATGGQFRLQIPLAVSSGETSAIQSVTIRLGNSVGESTETTIPRL